MSLFSLVIGGLHCLFGFIHLSDPTAAIDMIHGPGYTTNDSVDATVSAHLSRSSPQPHHFADEQAAFVNFQ